MKIILAFDSFKNCMSSPEICEILRSTLLSVLPGGSTVISMPLGDGGEGTARAMTMACGGIMQQCRVHGPLGKMVDAEYGLLPDNSAVLEMASASGIELIDRDERNPALTSTYGTGELLRHLVCDRAISDLLIGIGGSATVDCGIGMLQALGVKFFAIDNSLIPCPATADDIGRIAQIDTAGLPVELKNCRIRIASDVTNPLCGLNGAARVFGPQKGADAQMVEKLEKNLDRFGKLAIASGMADNMTTPGDGAAGGLGFALRNFLHADTESGAELVLKALHFDQALQDADWVITGEGCSDFQTAHGKLPSVVAKHARQYKVPTILLSGALGEKAIELENIFDAVLALSARPCSLDQAIADTPENLRRMIKSIANMITLKR